MTSTLCQSAALERIFAPWMAKIAEFLYIIVETILTIAQILRTTLLETMGGRHARLLRHRAGFLLPSASALHAAIGAPARITDNRKVDLDVSLSAEMREVWQALSPQVLLNRSREDQSVEANGDDAVGRLEGHDIGRQQKNCPHVKYLRRVVNPLSATEH